jgi:hypothetical protein
MVRLQKTPSIPFLAATPASLAELGTFGAAPPTVWHEQEQIKQERDEIGADLLAASVGGQESDRRRCCLTEGCQPLLKLDEGTPASAAASQREACGEDGCVLAEVRV